LTITYQAQLHYPRKPSTCKSWVGICVVNLVSWRKIPIQRSNEQTDCMDFKISSTLVLVTDLPWSSLVCPVSCLIISYTETGGKFVRKSSFGKNLRLISLLQLIAVPNWDTPKKVRKYSQSWVWWTSER